MSNINAIFLEGRATGPFEGEMVCREKPKPNTAKTQSKIPRKCKVKYRENAKCIVLSEMEDYNIVEVVL